MQLSLREIVAAILALIVIAVFCLIVLYDIVNNHPVLIPDSLLVLVSLVTGVYFGQHASTNGAYTAGAIAAKTAAAAAGITDATVTKPAP